jgi:hypothetical protein
MHGIIPHGGEKNDRVVRFDPGLSDFRARIPRLIPPSASYSPIRICVPEMAGNDASIYVEIPKPKYDPPKNPED